MYGPISHTYKVYSNCCRVSLFSNIMIYILFIVVFLTQDFVVYFSPGFVMFLFYE